MMGWDDMIQSIVIRDYFFLSRKYSLFLGDCGELLLSYYYNILDTYLSGLPSPADSQVPSLSSLPPSPPLVLSYKAKQPQRK